MGFNGVQLAYDGDPRSGKDTQISCSVRTSVSWRHV